MKKDHIRDYAIDAFRFYASVGCKDAAEYEAYLKEKVYQANRTENPQEIMEKVETEIAKHCSEFTDLEAVHETFSLLIDMGRPEIIEAVKAVYLINPDKKISRGEIDRRVTRFSCNFGIAKSGCYRWLKQARNLFAATRGLRL